METRAPLYWRFRQERYAEGLPQGLLRYVKAYNRETGRAEVRSLRFRNFEVSLAGSIYDFGASCMKRVLNIAGLTDRPDDAARMVLRMTVDYGEQVADQLDEYVDGMADTLSVHILGETPVTASDVEALQVELSDVALTCLADKASKGKAVNHEQAAILMRRCGMTYAEAREDLQTRFGLNGTAESVAEPVYFKERL